MADAGNHSAQDPTSEEKKGDESHELYEEEDELTEGKGDDIDIELGFANELDAVDNNTEVKIGDNNIQEEKCEQEGPPSAVALKVNDNTTPPDSSVSIVKTPESDSSECLSETLEEGNTAPVNKPVKRFQPPIQQAPNPKKTKSTATEGKGTEATKKPSTGPKKRKRRPAFGEPDSDSDTPEPQMKRSVLSRPTLLSGPVWVQCENIGCQKWRKLKDCYDPSELPEDWKCSLNTDPEHNSCSAPEEDWNECVGENQEYVESPFVPGSIVWAKMEGYPW